MRKERVQINFVELYELSVYRISDQETHRNKAEKAMAVQSKQTKQLFFRRRIQTSNNQQVSK